MFYLKKFNYNSPFNPYAIILIDISKIKIIFSIKIIGQIFSSLTSPYNESKIVFNIINSWITYPIDLR
jgi:hypothetical protein